MVPNTLANTGITFDCRTYSDMSNCNPWDEFASSASDSKITTATGSISSSTAGVTITNCEAEIYC